MFMKKAALITYVVAVHVALALVLATSNFIPKVKMRLGLRWDNKDEITAQLIRYARFDGLVPRGAVVFLGDSITYRVPVAAMAPLAVNYGIGGLTASQLLASLPSYSKALRDSGVIVLEIGTNDVLNGAAAALPGTYSKLFAALPANKPLVVSSMMPIAGASDATVRQINSYAQQLCQTRPACTFVNTWPAMVGADGGPNPSLFVDGVHPNGEGNQRWIALMRPAVGAAVQASL